MAITGGLNVRFLVVRGPERGVGDVREGVLGGGGHLQQRIDGVLFFFQAEDGIRDYKVTGVQTCALPISAPSANRYGRLSPTRAEHVREELGEAARVILDGGECQIGLESTIVSFEDGGVRLLRPGSVTATQLRRSEEHTSELQSPCNLVCRLLLEKKKNQYRMLWRRASSL